MKEFWEYFLGQGTEVEFVNFSFAHIAPVALMIAAIALTYRFRDRLRRSRFDSAIRYVMAFALVLSEFAYFWRLVAMPSLEPNPIDHLPLTVCGWAVIFCSYMVIGKTQTLFDISYFWLLCGSVFALITPTVITYTGPTRFRYYQFWIQHTLGFVAIFYMIFVHGMRPTVRSAFKSYGALAVLAAIAYCTNRMLGPGANYLFMARPEDTPSILDILPAHFGLRLLIMASAVTFLYFLAYLPWYLKDKKAKKAAACAAA